MTELRRTNSLAGLRDFEATARSGSFAAAGQELGISASAVSQQVKLLEERLGVRLFDRGPQSLSVTASGRKLLAALTSAFDLIEQSLANVAHATKEPADPGNARLLCSQLVLAAHAAISDQLSCFRNSSEKQRRRASVVH